MALDYKGSLNRYRKYLQSVHQQPLLAASFWLILSLTLIILLISLALRPTLVTIASLLGEIKQQESTVTQLDQKIASVQKAGNQLQAVRSRLPLLTEAIPDEIKWQDFSRSVEQMATDSGVNLTQITFGNAPIKGKPEVSKSNTTNPAATETKPTLPQGITGISFTLTGQGYYPQIRDLITKLENTRRMLIITSVLVAKRETGDLLVTVQGVATYTNTSQATTP